MISNSICSAAKRQATCRYSYFRSIAWELHSLGCDCAMLLGLVGFVISGVGGWPSCSMYLYSTLRVHVPN